MDLNYLRRLVKIFDDSTLENLEIEEEGIKYKFSRTKSTNVVNYTVPEVQPIITQTPVQPVPVPTVVQPEVVEKPMIKINTEEQIDLFEVKSPMVGTFYCAPSPDSPPFVEIGQSIKKGQTLCIIEAMKLMNQIESEVNGTIEKILVENGKPVEFGQALFLVKVE